MSEAYEREQLKTQHFGKCQNPKDDRYKELRLNSVQLLEYFISKKKFRRVMFRFHLPFHLHIVVCVSP